MCEVMKCDVINKIYLVGMQFSSTVMIEYHATDMM